MKYSNFNNPFRLFFEMLRSRNRAAYFTLLREGLFILLKPLDFLLVPFEKRLLGRKHESELPVILIIGVARSGTTLVYQALSEYLPVSYFNNLSAFFPRSTIVASKLFRHCVRRRKGDFSNYFGNVSGFGAPNEGLHIWNRWFGNDRNNIQDELSEEQISSMKIFLNAWNDSFKLPLLNKSNRNSQALRILEKAIPGMVYYLVVQRDPVYVIQSLIQSRETIQGDKRIGWGVGADQQHPEYQNVQDSLLYIDDICNQVFKVQGTIEDDLKHVDPKRYMLISYEKFCQSPQKIIRQVADKIFNTKKELPLLDKLKPFKNTNRQKVTDQEFNRILDTVKSRSINEK